MNKPLLDETFVRMESALSLRIVDKKMNDMPLDDNILREKAKKRYATKNTPMVKTTKIPITLKFLLKSRLPQRHQQNFKQVIDDLIVFLETSSPFCVTPLRRRVSRSCCSRSLACTATKNN